MGKLLNLALAPIIIILFYIYIRDKYEKEPLNLLFSGLLYGVIISAPIVFSENFIMRFAPKDQNSIYYYFFTAFFVASLVEETYKYIVLYFLIWKNKNFNEPFDGIVYSVFISLGFAAIENVLYVLNPEIGGFKTAISRAFISVPAHGLFGIFMGFYFAISKFKNNKKFFAIAFLVPFLIHAVYDLLLFTNLKYGQIFFVLFIIYLWISSFRKMKFFINLSPFKK